jgi:hypothetical protein
VVLELRAPPLRLNRIVQQILGLLQVTSAASVKIQIGLDWRDDQRRADLLRIHEHTGIVGRDETKLRSSVRPRFEVTKLCSELAIQDENINQVDIDEWPNTPA